MAAAHANNPLLYVPAALCLALFLWSFNPRQTPLRTASYGPSDTPDVVKATEQIFPTVTEAPGAEGNPLFTAENKGRILVDFKGEPPHEGEPVNKQLPAPDGA